MNRIAVISILFCLTQISCSKDSSHSPEIPETIKLMIDENTSCYCEPYINLYEWRGQEIYFYSGKGPLCNWMPAYFNSKGVAIQMDGGYRADDFLGDSKLVKVIWTCAEGNGS
ncbi:MAG: hypothetical protein WDN26_23340 [Chitinophagaceae bacterium]